MQAPSETVASCVTPQRTERPVPELQRGMSMIVFKIDRHFLRRVAAQALALLFLASAGYAGPYRESAHGDGDEGVHRLVPGVSSPGPYITGNCAHCHEQHASMGGQEPVPQNGGPSPFALFAPPFDSARRFAPYQMEDVFCFYCHSGASSMSANPFWKCCGKISA